MIFSFIILLLLKEVDMVYPNMSATTNNIVDTSKSNIGLYRLLDLKNGHGIVNYRYLKNTVNWKVYISNIPNGVLCKFSFRGVVQVLNEGLNIINAIGLEGAENMNPMINFSKTIAESEMTPVIIQFEPEYKGALVSDGVDDYGLCENFPILDRDRGYTIFSIRKILVDNSLNLLLSNASNVQEGESGAFLYEYRSISKGTASFGVWSAVDKYPDLFSYQTSVNYCGVSINKGDKLASNFLKLFWDKGFKYSSIALYALEIYDRDLTDEEIAKVKARMIAEYKTKTGEKYPIEYPGLIAAWDVKGKTNSDSDRDVLKDLTGNGHDITLYNFVFNDESGYITNGLKFDGIDDRGYVENIPYIKEPTIIFKSINLEGSNSEAFNFSLFKKEAIQWQNYTYLINRGSGQKGIVTFGSYNNNIIQVKNGIFYIKSDNYNGQKMNPGGSGLGDSNIFTIGNNINYASNVYSKLIFNQAYLFNRYLSDEEIESFIKKYIDKDYVLPNV